MLMLTLIKKQNTKNKNDDNNQNGDNNNIANTLGVQSPVRTTAAAGNGFVTEGWEGSSIRIMMGVGIISSNSSSSSSSSSSSTHSSTS